MKKLNLFIVCQLLFILTPLFSIAQTNQVEKFTITKSFDEFVSNLKKNIIIDKADYNVCIDYLDNESKELIITGEAKNLGGLTSETFNIVSSRLSFQVTVKQLTDDEWGIYKNKMMYSFKSSYGKFDYLSTEMLEKIREEMEIMVANRNKFEIADFLYKKRDDYIKKLEEYKSMSEDTSLKKKDRKYAMYQYDNLKAKCEFYQTLCRNSESIITKLMLYYLY